jgi:hypothetical protein
MMEQANDRMREEGNWSEFSVTYVGTLRTRPTVKPASPRVPLSRLLAAAAAAAAAAIVRLDDVSHRATSEVVMNGFHKNAGTDSRRAL